MQMSTVVVERSLDRLSTAVMLMKWLWNDELLLLYYELNIVLLKTRAEVDWIWRTLARFVSRVHRSSISLVVVPVTNSRTMQSTAHADETVDCRWFDDREERILSRIISRMEFCFILFVSDAAQSVKLLTWELFSCMKFVELLTVSVKTYGSSWMSCWHDMTDHLLESLWLQSFWKIGWGEKQSRMLQNRFWCLMFVGLFTGGDNVSVVE